MRLAGQPYTGSPQKRPTRGFSGRAGTSENESGRGLPTGRMADDEMLPVTQISSKKFEAQSAPVAKITSQMAGNIRALFPGKSICAKNAHVYRNSIIPFGTLTSIIDLLNK
ncbi:partition protein [Escherichia phage 503458]|uniref:partition protein n=1 Tax=Escherichia phage 503458 TaxID=2716350 RepID=UPI0018AD2668|nr:partition protein [Escherichia phage 503458]